MNSIRYLCLPRGVCDLHYIGDRDFHELLATSTRCLRLPRGACDSPESLVTQGACDFYEVLLTTKMRSLLY